jgi:hypothetical protein
MRELFQDRANAPGLVFANDGSVAEALRHRGITP